MNLWERLPDETDQAYNAFILYLESKPPRPTQIEMSKMVNVTQETIKIWKSRFSWGERVVAYEKWLKEVDSEQRLESMKEHAHKLTKELYKNIQRLLIENSVYLEKLTKNNMDDIRNLNVHELRENANENLELIAKLIKPFKEIAVMTPEGKQLIEQDQDVGDKIFINVQPVVKEADVIEADEDDIDVIEYDEDDNGRS